MNENTAALRRTLEQYDTPKLDGMLRQALEKEPPDGPMVRAILRVLREREGNTVPAAGRKTPGAGVWLGRAAAVAAVVFLLLLAVPQPVAAETFFERLMRWTDSIFELFSPGEERAEPEYEFRTDNPGLQRIYDAVTDLGITAPVVPMWIPEEYELVKCKLSDTPTYAGILAEFASAQGSLLIKIDLNFDNVAYEYYKDDAQVEIVEMAGTDHCIMYNDGLWVVVWTRDNIKGFIRVDCQEDVLSEILRSIYVMEE